MQAILVSDIHLQANAPVCRAGEPDWFAAMTRPLQELAALQKHHGGAPILYAGDIFDQWHARPEVINFALTNLPQGYAVPGQHDLPDHNYAEIHRSAYWTLVEAGCIQNLGPGERHIIKTPDKLPLAVYGFPWGCPIHSCEETVVALRVAVVHSFIWQKDAGYIGAPVDRMVGACKNMFRGYTAVAFGDNHKGFIADGDGVAVCNCGGLMRRKIDERNYRPGVGLLHADGAITRHYLDITEDHFAAMTEAEEAVAQVLDMSAFVDGLRNLETNDALDFIAALKRFIRDNKTPPQVAEVILQASEGVQK